MKLFLLYIEEPHGGRSIDWFGTELERDEALRDYAAELLGAACPDTEAAKAAIRRAGDFYLDTIEVTR